MKKDNLVFAVLGLVFKIVGRGFTKCGEYLLDTPETYDTSWKDAHS